MFDIGFPRDWSSLKKLIWLKAITGGGGSSPVWKTVTGAFIHITNALASPMQKCEVTLEPIQDLHGQDAPYPAGGGKQLINDSIKTISGYSLIIGAETFSEYNYYLEAGTTYRLTVFRTTTAQMYGYCQLSGSSENIIIINNSSAQTPTNTFTPDTSGQYKFWLYAGSGGVVDGSVTHVMLTKGSETVSEYSPYSNICPITGWTGLTVEHTGKNILPATFLTGYYDTADGSFVPSSNWRASQKIRCKPSTNYFLSGSSYGDGGTNGRPLFWDKYGNYLSYGNTGNLITTPANAYKMAFYIGKDYLTNVMQIEEGSTATDYEAFNGTTLSVTFPDSTGTVYGGTVDLVSGE